MPVCYFGSFCGGLIVLTSGLLFCLTFIYWSVFNSLFFSYRYLPDVCASNFNSRVVASSIVVNESPLMLSF